MGSTKRVRIDRSSVVDERCRVSPVGSSLSDTDLDLTSFGDDGVPVDLYAGVCGASKEKERKGGGSQLRERKLAEHKTSMTHSFQSRESSRPC